MEKEEKDKILLVVSMFIGAFIILMFLNYLAFGFIAATLNPMKWSMLCRFMYVIISSIISIASSVGLVSFYMEEID